MTQFLLDSGDPEEYITTSKLAKASGNKLWGGTTNPTLIVRALKNKLKKKLSFKQAFELQKKNVLEILEIVPGSVSAEVYADKSTTAEEMILQGLEIASWHKRVAVKIPTTLEGFKARTELRRQGICVNNTLVFSQEQIFAIFLHEQLIQQIYNPKEKSNFRSFISPFVGRIDDLGQDGLMIVENGMEIKRSFDFPVWMLVASVRKIEHVNRALLADADLITAPAGVYCEWFSLPKSEKDALNLAKYARDLKPIRFWKAPAKFRQVETIEDFLGLIESGKLNISHPLTSKGIDQFAKDWNSIIK